MSIVTIYPARLAEWQGRRWWRCPTCNRTLAEVLPDRVIIKIGDRVISLAWTTVLEQSCPYCGTHSVLDEVA